MNDVNKKAYSTPMLENVGKVADLTQTGKTREGGDVKTGSIMHSQAPGNESN